MLLHKIFFRNTTSLKKPNKFGKSKISLACAPLRPAPPCALRPLAPYAPLRPPAASALAKIMQFWYWAWFGHGINVFILVYVHSVGYRKDIQRLSRHSTLTLKSGWWGSSSRSWPQRCDPKDVIPKICPQRCDLKDVIPNMWSKRCDP